MTSPTALGDLAERLARLDLAPVATAALASEGETLARAVRAALSHPPGTSHEYPWLQSGALRDSIVSDADAEQAIVASTSDVALYQEHGTTTVPPRPFLAPVAAAGSGDLAAAIASAISTALANAVADRAVQGSGPTRSPGGAAVDPP